MTVEAYTFETWQVVVIGVIVVLEVILKGLALWKAARNDQSVWFTVLLVLNTAGVLPLLYLLFSKPNTDK